MREADGSIIRTPEYNHGYPAILKNALDTVYHAWSRKAVAFVSWGGDLVDERPQSGARARRVSVMPMPPRIAIDDSTRRQLTGSSKKTTPPTAAIAGTDS